MKKAASQTAFTACETAFSMLRRLTCLRQAPVQAQLQVQVQAQAQVWLQVRV
jgi:hypothetical protein